MFYNVIPPYPLTELDKGESKINDWKADMYKNGNVMRFKRSNGDSVEVFDFDEHAVVYVTDSAGNKIKGIFHKQSLDIDNLFDFVDRLK
ncbi:hypothetical protein [Aeromonas intestinalis]